MTQFDWHTEDDDELWNQGERPSRPVPPGKNKPWLQWGLAALVLIVGFGFIWRGYSRLHDEVTEVTETVDADLLSSQELLVAAMQQDDLELFLLILSGRDPNWTRAQQELFKDGLVYGRRAFGMTLISPEPEIEGSKLAPDLLSAELTLFNQYAIDVGNGVTETVILSQTAVFRQGVERWLFSPPEEEFWGEIIQEKREHLNITYPARDAYLIDRLAFDLNRKLVEMCLLIPDNCQPDVEILIEFSPDPASFLASSDPVRQLQGMQPLIMPTPTLFGMPQNEAGYQALLRGYGQVMVYAALPKIIGWDCCAEVDQYKLFVENLLERMALVPSTDLSAIPLIKSGFVPEIDPVIELSLGNMLQDSDSLQIQIFNDGRILSSIFSADEEAKINPEEVVQLRRNIFALDEESGVLSLLQTDAVPTGCDCVWYRLVVKRPTGVYATVELIDLGNGNIPEPFWLVIGEIRQLLEDLTVVE